MKGPVTLAKLDRCRREILGGIVDRGEIWMVEDGEHAFVLGPEVTLGRVLGLYDEEYGWPAKVDADGPIEAFAPAQRRHPVIMRDGKVIAMAVWPEEYADLIKKDGDPA